VAGPLFGAEVSSKFTPTPRRSCCCPYDRPDSLRGRTYYNVRCYRLHAPGDNRPQWGRWTQLILPVSGCDINASVRVLSNPFSAHADLVATRLNCLTTKSPSAQSPSTISCQVPHLPVGQIVLIAFRVSSTDQTQTEISCSICSIVDCHDIQTATESIVLPAANECLGSDSALRAC
jgi:hypothetical protein